MVFRKYRKCKTNPLNRGFKEKTIIESIMSDLDPIHAVSQNRQIEGGSSRRRPDLHILCDGYHIIIEIDERQHRTYSDDTQRVNDLINDVKGDLVLIRFNPDSYKSGGKSFRSLFSKTRGTRIYKIGCPKKFEERMAVLKQLIYHYLSNRPEESYIEHRLYFNGYATPTS